MAGELAPLVRVEHVRLAMPQGLAHTLNPCGYWAIAVLSRTQVILGTLCYFVCTKIHTGSNMQFEWDEEKNQTNIHKHGIDFQYAVDIFNHPMLSQPDNRANYGEDR